MTVKRRGIISARYSYSLAELRRIFNIPDMGEAILKVEGVSPSGRVLEMRVGDKTL